MNTEHTYKTHYIADGCGIRVTDENNDVVALLRYLEPANIVGERTRQLSQTLIEAFNTYFTPAIEHGHEIGIEPKGQSDIDLIYNIIDREEDKLYND